MSTPSWHNEPIGNAETLLLRHVKTLGGKSWSTCWHICSNIVTFSPIYPKAQFAWYSNCIAVWSLCAKSRCWWHRCTQRMCNICYQAAWGTKLLWNTHFRWKALALSVRITVAFGKGKENLPQVYNHCLCNTFCNNQDKLTSFWKQNIIGSLHRF